MDREPCTIDDRMGECDAGICIEQLCGDGVVSGREDCDGSTTADCTSIGYRIIQPDADRLSH